MKTLNKALMIVTVASALALPLSALAETPYISIPYDTRELETTNGQNQLYDKMKKASREICESTHQPITRTLPCYRGTLTAAVKRLDRPEITALHLKS